MKVIVTAGPSYEPIDEVRRITNFSTGELGVLLSNHLVQAGHELFCLKGVAATYPGPLLNAHHLPFTTNDDLLATLRRLSREHDIAAVFHVAALADFKVKQVEDATGRPQTSAKIDSRCDFLTIRLEPAKKIIAELRTLFPKALLVGWKYEVTGTRADALAKAWSQLRENRTDACVLNGAAWGSGCAFCTLPDQIHELPDRAALVQFLADWLTDRRGR
jgi:phosphopantothenoylcysteine synthetase/decarboxylase